MKQSIRAALLLLLLCGCTVLVGQSPSSVEGPFPLIGKWKLNLEKSTYTPDARLPPPNAKQGTSFVQVLEWKARPDGMIVFTAVTITVDGVPDFSQSVFRYDGKDYPYWNQDRLADFQANDTKTPQTQISRPIDANTVEIIEKTNGKPRNQERTRTISGDGKTMTDVTRGTSAQGQEINNVAVFDRVP